MTFALDQIILALWNFANSRIDAYRILKNKRIAHGINFGAYVLIVAALFWLGRFDIKELFVYLPASFCNRQLSFDIPLNLRRGLPWFYQSMDNPPKALMDRIERKFFGMDYDGKKIVFWYSAFYFFFIVIRYASYGYNS